MPSDRLAYDLADPVQRTLRMEALERLRLGIPHWMSVEDLIHAGWLGWQEGLRRADPAKGESDQYARKWARGAMRAEVTRWSGGFRPRDNVALVAFDIREHEYGSIPGSEELHQEREEFLESLESMLKDFMSQMKLRERQAVYFRYIQELSYREVGEALGVTAQQAARLVAQGLQSMRKRLCAA